MPKPSTVFTWATDTNFSSGPDSGTPTKVAPGGSAAQGGIPESKFPAQWLNYLHNLAGQWVTYLDSWFNGSDEIVYPVTKTRVLRLSDKVFTPDIVGGVPVWDRDAAAAMPHWQTSNNTAYLVCNLSDWLPDGATITLVRTLLQPGDSIATSGNRVLQRVAKRSRNWTTPSLGAEVVIADTRDGGTNALQLVSSGAISEALDKSAEIVYVQIVSAAAHAVGSDIVFGIEVTFTDPGPRNF